MASSAGKAAQSPGPGSTVNGTAAELATIEQELYDYQMHNKMCKKIAQLTKVIYSLNMRNEEQEAALQALSHAHHDELHRILMETCHEGEGSVLRTRLLELQESLDEQQRVGAQGEFEYFRVSAMLPQEWEILAKRKVFGLQPNSFSNTHEVKQTEDNQDCLHLHHSYYFEFFRIQAEERERETEAELRKEFQEKLRAAEEGLLEAKADLSAAQDESLRLSKDLMTAGEQIQELYAKCEELQKLADEDKQEDLERVKALLREEREQWEQKVNDLHEENEQMRKKMHSALRERVKRAEAEVEGHLERLSESKRNTVKLQERIQDLEEELELDRKRVSEAEAVVKRAEEELAVAKERLLLQEDELQSRAANLKENRCCEVCVCAELEELKSQVNRLQSRNRELELQSSGRNSDHAQVLSKHAEALSSLRSEMVRAQTEELRRIQKHVDTERANVQQKLEEEKKRLAEKAEEDRKRLKEQVRKAIEEVMRRHAAELNNVQEALSSERKTNQEVCARLEEERRSAEELRKSLEREKDELRAKLKDTNAEISRLEAVIQQNGEKKEKVAGEAAPSCGPRCSRLEEELGQARSRLARAQEEAERQRDRQQRETASLRADKHRLEEKVLEQSRMSTERNLLEQSQRHMEDCIRAEFRIEMNAAVAESEQRWQGKEQELQGQVSELQAQLTELQAQEDDSHANPEIDKLRKEVQDTKEINKKLRELQLKSPTEHELLHRFSLCFDASVAVEMNGASRSCRLEECSRCKINRKEPQSQSLAEERHSHAMALQALERQAKEDLLSEINRLQTMHHLELDKQRAELTQQHTEWSRQMTQRHMQQIEDLQAQLQAHTQMMALQQVKDLKQQNQYQVFERQLDESRCAMLELQRENTALKKQLQERSVKKNSEVEEKEEESIDTKKNRDAQLEEEAQRLKEEVEKLRVEMEKLEESQKQVSEYSSAQNHLQARIVALENELREREERCRRREPRYDDMSLGRLQERLMERDQLIKRLVEERHQLQLHPPVAGDNSTLRLRDSKSRPGSVTPTMRKTTLYLEKIRIDQLFSYDASTPVQLPSPRLSPLLHLLSPTQAHLPLPEPTFLPVPPSLPQVPDVLHPSHPGANRSSARLPLTSDGHPIRVPLLPGATLVHAGPVNQQRGTEGLKQEWFTKYFSF
uniref:Family with sequence similarity 184 member B n=1 Tax=Poecilia formosa TaxID=48698 RepID=A0A096M779_POEFO